MSRRRVALRSVVLIATLAAFAPIAGAFTFDPAVAVDPGVLAVPDESGPSIAHAFDAWHIVYEKAGDIFRARRTAAGWQPPEPVSSDPSASHTPRIAFSDGLLHVVWVDERSGTPEVWHRSHDGASWSAEACLSCGSAVASEEPSLPAEAAAGELLVVWRDGSGASAEIQGRLFDGGSFGAVETVAGPGASAPAVVSLGGVWNAGHRIAWLEGGELWMRNRGFDGTLTTPWHVQIGGDVEQISLHYDDCCADVVQERVSVGLRITNSGDEVLASVDRGEEFPTMTPVSSGIGPQVTGFRFPMGGCSEFGGLFARRVFASTASGAPRRHEIGLYDHNGNQLNTTVISLLGLDEIVVAATEGKPDAPILAAWIELRNTVPTLVASVGRTLGGQVFDFDETPQAIVIGPAGVPSFDVRVIDGYDGTPAPGEEIVLELYGSLPTDLLFDGVNPPFSEMTDADGRATFSIRGGGCSQNGAAQLYCWFGSPFENYDGVKSPDVDGNCVVDAGDRAYVVARLGTSDFCADLDGSAFVDAADVAIVDATMDDACQTVSVDGAVAPAVAALTLVPNPAVGATSISLAMPGARAARAGVYDAAGRLVRDLGGVSLENGRARLEWRGRDAGDRPVAPGRYFVVVTSEDDGPATRLVRAVTWLSFGARE